MSNRKVVIITGGNTGIGFETAKALFGKGFHVIIACRSEAKAQEAVNAIQQSTNNGGTVEYGLLDNMSLQSVRDFADWFKSKTLPLHVLINNAGIMATPFELSSDGYEAQYQVNHLSHFLLTLLLLDILKQSKPSRIINLSSRAHIRFQEPIDYAKLKNENANTYDAWQSYGRSKLSNIIFTYELHRRLNGDNNQSSSASGVSVYALHPGLVNTQLLTKANFQPGSGIDVSDGAKTPIYLATDAAVEGVSGLYYFESRPEQSTPISYDKEEGRKLWQYSSEWTGVKA